MVQELRPRLRITHSQTYAQSPQEAGEVRGWAWGYGVQHLAGCSEGWGVDGQLALGRFLCI